MLSSGLSDEELLWGELQKNKNLLLLSVVHSQTEMYHLMRKAFRFITTLSDHMGRA